MHEIQVIERCDFCRNELDEEARKDIQITVGGRLFLVDVCGDCFSGENQYGIEEVLNTIQTNSRPSQIAPERLKPQKSHKPRRQPGEPRYTSSLSEDPNRPYDFVCDQPGCTSSFTRVQSLAVHLKHKHGIGKEDRAA